MSVDPIRFAAEFEDFSKRFVSTTTVIQSPAAAAEQTIAAVTVTEPEQVASGVRLRGWAAFTVGTSGTAVRLRIRKDSITGTVVADTGAVTAGIAAAALAALSVNGGDAAPTLPNQAYLLTMQVTAGAAISTVSGVSLDAVVV